MMAAIFSAGAFRGPDDAPSVTLSLKTICVQELLVYPHKYSARSLCLMHRVSCMFVFQSREKEQVLTML